MTATCRGTRSHERRDVLVRQRGRRRVVRVADDDEARRRRDLGEHRVEVVALVVVERDRDRARAGRRREVRVDAERRPRVDELRAGLEQRLAGGEQDVARAVADRDPRRRHAVAVAQRAAQLGVRRVRIAVGARDRALRRLDDRRQRRVGRLVGREHRDVVAEVVAARDGIDRKAPDALGELDRHAGIVAYAPRGARDARLLRALEVLAQRARLAEVDVAAACASGAW